MSIPTYSDYKKEVEGALQIVSISKVALTTVAGQLFSQWLVANNAGAAPTTAVAPTNATVGALPIWNTTNPLRLLQIQTTFPTGGMIMLCDRLSHQGGLSGTVASPTVQTTNLPTAALTRYTTGEGVLMGYEVHTAIGATATTITVSYTNELGTSGRTSQAAVIGGTGFNTASRFVPISLQAGDKGVRSVQSATLAATTGTAGAFGIVLYKPLAMIYIPGGPLSYVSDAVQSLGMNIAQIQSNACLFFLTSVASTSTGAINNDLILGQE